MSERSRAGWQNQEDLYFCCITLRVSPTGECAVRAI
nr:hypothetical protein 1137p_00002 [Serratia proteamaculans]